MELFDFGFEARLAVLLRQVGHHATVGGAAGRVRLLGQRGVGLLGALVIRRRQELLFQLALRRAALGCKPSERLLLRAHLRPGENGP